MQKILVGTIVRQQPAVLQAYVDSLRKLLPPPKTSIAFAFVNDGDGETQAILQQLEPAMILPATPREPSNYGVGGQTHHWDTAAIDHVARNKQRLMEYAVEAGYSHVFFVDSDLLLEPTTLQSLYSLRAQVANGVFWTRWMNEPGQRALPQCWLRHPYDFNGLGKQEYEFINELVERQAVRCLGGGACVLISTDAIRKGLRYWPRLEGLPQEGMWQGEDRTFALIAERLHIRQYADAWPDIFHAYHPEQREPESLQEAAFVLRSPRQLRANYGDMVNFTVDPLEDPGLQDALRRNVTVRSVRGRLGGIKMAAEIEHALLEMKPGDERILSVHMPAWHMVPEYRSRAVLIKLNLIDIKPYSYAPLVADEVFLGLPADG